MRAMALLAHIVFAILGVLAAYVYGAASLRGSRGGAFRWGRALTLLSLAGLTVSGAFLFAADPQVFLASGKFLSNMTIMLLLVGIELFALLWPSRSLRIASLFSWTWIFAAALINPPYPYAYFMLGYAVLLSVALLLAQRFAAGAGSGMLAEESH